MTGTVAGCLIVQDEATRLPAALQSLAFCDEIIVVDGGSRDRTVEVALAEGAKVIENPWPGYSAQRNVALDAASSDWILEVDADERVTEELARSIRALVAAPPDGVDAAVCALRNRFLGALLGPSAKYPQYRLRLFRRDRYRHDEALPVHEGLSARERTGLLEGDLEHELASTWAEALRDVWNYSRLQARYLNPPNSLRAYVYGMATRPATKFAYRLTIEGGWRDGWRGFAKMTLDCCADVLVWALLLKRRVRGRTDGAPESTNSHFGRGWWAPPGPVKFIAVAAGEDATRRAATWLGQVMSAGAEVGLITDSPKAAAGGVRVRAIPRMGPLHILRALEAESQMQPADAVVMVGRVRSMARLLPRHLRGAATDITDAADPIEAEARVRRVTRGSAQPRHRSAVVGFR